MTPAEIKRLKDTAEKLQILETRLGLLLKNRENLDKAKEGRDLSVKVSVQVGGTSTHIFLTEGMMEDVYYDIKSRVNESITLVNADIARLPAP